MAFKPNYRQQRGERNRAKAEKQQEKLQRRDEAAEKRRGGTRRLATDGDRHARGGQRRETMNSHNDPRIRLSLVRKNV